MTTVTATSVNPYNITLNWTEVTSPGNGGDTPTFYLVQWKDYENGGNWVSLTSEASPPPNLLSYTHVRTTAIFSPTV